MKTRKRNASLLPVLSLTALFALSGCDGGGLSGGNGARLRVVLSNGGVAAAPALSGSDGDREKRNDDSRLSHFFESAQVTLSSILVRNLNGQLINVDLALPVTVDVVKIEGGKQVMLPAGILPAGTYDQVVLVITAVVGTTRNGTVITIEPPGGGWTAVIPICELAIAEGAAATVDITLNVRNSFLQAGTHWDFQPRFLARHACVGTGP